MNDMLTPTEAADALRKLGARIGPPGVRYWVREGIGGRRLPATRAGSRILIRRADLMQFVEKVNAPAGAA